jgi:L-malate glycosyltransferase
MRVAIVATSPRWIGGHSVQADLLMRHWKDDPAVEIHFIAIDPEIPGWLGRLRRVRYLRTMLRTPIYVSALWNGIKDIDIVHIFSASYWSFLVAVVPAWLIGRLLRKPILIHYHSGEARDHLRRWRSAVSILSHTERLVVPSQYLVDVFREFGLNASVVPNIVPCDEFRFRRREPQGTALLCTRHFEPYYGVDLVVRAFARIKKEFPAARLCLVGKGSQEKEIRALVRQLNLTDVQFAGPVEHREIGQFYDRADIFVNASWLDNMPVSILEAYASGTPVVSTAPEGIQYIVKHEHTGLLCTPGDWQQLAENTLRLLRDPVLAVRLASEAHEQSRLYHWAAVGRQWLQIYSSLYQARG